MVCALSLTDDMSDSPQGQQLVTFPAGYFYIPLKKKRIWYHQDILITKQYPKIKTQLSIQKRSLKPTESEEDCHKGSHYSVPKFDVAQKVIFYARGFFPN